MATGLTYPISVDELGRAPTVSGSEQLKKLIMIALQPCSSENAFQNLGISERVIFAINAPNLKALLDRDIRRIFKTFERDKRAKVRNINFEVDSLNQELKVFITYQDLETTRDEDIVLILPASGNTRPRVAETKR